MSLNTAHANNGVLIHSGECIILFSDNVVMEFIGQDAALFKGTKNGRIYLTTHRMIYNNKNQSDPLQSFSFPFISINDVQIEQPVFGANYIKGKVRAQENGNWNGELKFKLLFKAGGAIDFGQAMLRAAHIAMKNAHNSAPPPYTPPTGAWYEAPPPAYSPNPQGYYGWLPNNQAFQTGPPPNSVFMHDNPPPYPGIVPQQGGGAQPPPNSGGPGFNGYPSGQPQSGYPGAQPGYPGGQSGYPGYPGSQPGYSVQPSYPGVPQQGFTGYPQGGYPGGAPAGYPNAPGYPGGYPGGAPTGYPSAPTGYQNGGAAGYQPQGGAMGFAPPQPNTKEAEAAQSAYFDPSRPQTAYVPPPPAYYEPPPSYNSIGDKKGQ